VVFTSRRQRRRRALAETFPDEWRRILDRRCAAWRSLSPDERTQLEDLTKVFVADVRWEPARGFEITDEMRVLVAAQACLLVLGLDEAVLDGRAFAHVRSIILHPSTVVLDGTRTTDTPGVVSSGPSHLDGEAHHRGPVLLSWSAVRTEALHPLRGRNVVFHEFAHQLDMLDGTVDGTPPLLDGDRRRRWIDVCTREFEAVRSGDDHLLRGYAATDPGEFFAVATEVFFTLPVELREQHADLYSVLADFYRQDPAARAS
jgi:Mlc titration factor MtfA (ptsG expression regulator)